MGGLAVDLEGKVALVSGGSSGMGTAMRRGGLRGPPEDADDAFSWM